MTLWPTYILESVEQVWQDEWLVRSNRSVKDFYPLIVRIYFKVHYNIKSIVSKLLLVLNLLLDPVLMAIVDNSEALFISYALSFTDDRSLRVRVTP